MVFPFSPFSIRRMGLPSLCSNCSATSSDPQNRPADVAAKDSYQASPSCRSHSHEPVHWNTARDFQQGACGQDSVQHKRVCPKHDRTGPDRRKTGPATNGQFGRNECFARKRGHSSLTPFLSRAGFRLGGGKLSAIAVAVGGRGREVGAAETG